jgi:hypothetical protein
MFLSMSTYSTGTFSLSSFATVPLAARIDEVRVDGADRLDVRLVASTFVGKAFAASG